VAYFTWTSIAGL